MVNIKGPNAITQVMIKENHPRSCGLPSMLLIAIPANTKNAHIMLNA